VPPNKSAIRFVKGLAAAFGKWRVSDETVEMYTEKLSNWRLTDDQWSRASSRIIAESTDLPSLSDIYRYLRAAQESAGQTGKGPYFLSFTLQKLQWAQRISHPMDRPGLPEGAENVHLVVPMEEQDLHEMIDAEAGRNWWYKGWSESGADQAKCEAMFTTTFAEK
jgi:hypothetical protein